MGSSRRIGVESSETRAAILDAAAQLMKDEGYPAVTTRRLASLAGVSNQLVHYYFRTMDDLFLALMRRGAEANLRHLRQALESEHPLQALWKLYSDPEAARIAMEFMALTNHRKTIAQETARHATQLRALETEALSRVLADHGISSDTLPPVTLALLMASLPRVMVMEAAMGVSSGHIETMALVNRLLRLFETPPRKRRLKTAKRPSTKVPQGLAKKQRR